MAPSGHGPAAWAIWLCMQLEPDGIVVELAAGQAGPLDGVLAFLDPLLGGAALMVERNHPLGRTAQVGDDEADAGVQFAGIPFDLGNHTTFLVPRTGLIAEVGVVAANMVGRPTNGPGQQVGDAFLENRVGRKADRVQKALGFEVFVRRLYLKVTRSRPSPAGKTVPEVMNSHIRQLGPRPDARPGVL